MVEKNKTTLPLGSTDHRNEAHLARRDKGNRVSFYDRFCLNMDSLHMDYLPLVIISLSRFGYIPVFVKLPPGSLETNEPYQ
jgi:hypothetical protein